jgi:hypothetical protein
MLKSMLFNKSHLLPTDTCVKTVSNVTIAIVNAYKVGKNYF